MTTLEPYRDALRAMKELNEYVFADPAFDHEPERIKEFAATALLDLRESTDALWASLHGLEVVKPHSCLCAITGERCRTWSGFSDDCPGCSGKDYLENVSLYARPGCPPSVLIAEPREYHDGLGRVAEMDAAELGLDLHLAVGGRPFLPGLVASDVGARGGERSARRDLLRIEYSADEKPFPSLYAASFVFVNQ